MQLWIAWQDCPAKRPAFRFRYQFGADGIRQDVKADSGERALFSFFIPQDVVVGLRLKVMRTQRRAEMFAQKLHAVALVRIKAKPHPEQVDVVWHQAIGRADQAFTACGMKHDFTEL